VLLVLARESVCNKVDSVVTVTDSDVAPSSIAMSRQGLIAQPGFKTFRQENVTIAAANDEAIRFFSNLNWSKINLASAVGGLGGHP
jgi:hypothetical protein